MSPYTSSSHARARVNSLRLYASARRLVNKQTAPPGGHVEHGRQVVDARVVLVLVQQHGGFELAFAGAVPEKLRHRTARKKEEEIHSISSGSDELGSAAVGVHYFNLINLHS